MPELADIRQGLADRLDAIPDLQVSPYVLANPTPPAAHLFPDIVEYDKTFGRGHDDWFFTVQAFVGMTGDVAAQINLDRMLAPSGDASVKEALESGSAIAGIEDVHVLSCSGYRRYAQSAGEVLGAEWRVRVLITS